MEARRGAVELLQLALEALGKIVQGYWINVCTFLGRLLSGWIVALAKFKFGQKERLEKSRREIVATWRNELLDGRHFNLMPENEQNKNATITLTNGLIFVRSPGSAYQSLQECPSFQQFILNSNQTLRSSFSKMINETNSSTADVYMHISKPNYISTTIEYKNIEIITSANILKELIANEITDISRRWGLE